VTVVFIGLTVGFLLGLRFKVFVLIPTIPSGRDTDRHRRDKLVECRANASDVSGPPDGLSRRPHRACDSLASIQNLSWVALNLPLAALTGISDRSRDILVPLLASESVRAQLGRKGQGQPSAARIGGPAGVVSSPRVDNSISVQRFDVSHGTPVLVSRAAAAGSCPPTAPLATLATRSALAIPTCPRGQVGQ
jgi:hypothetical protein